MLQIEKLYSLFLNYPEVGTDTRNIGENSIFFALKGENFDANSFAFEALMKGAAYAVIDDVRLPVNEKFILVDDVLVTLQNLASYHRQQFKIPIIGLTGSNGKTTTKELLGSVLERKYKVLATEGNLNNHIGVPLTLLRLNRSHEIAIIEMGANHQGEIEFLCNISDPDFGIITNVGKAHLKGFGSFEGVVKTKTELYRHIAKKAGMVFVNSTDKLLMTASEGIERELYGSESNCAANYEISSAGTIQLRFNDSPEKTVKTNLFGEYNLQNLVCSYCVGNYFGVDQSEIHLALSGYVPKNNRSQIIKSNKNTIILDAYNANPSSMTLAIESFGRINAKKKAVILGDMLELGDEEIIEHRNLLKQLIDLKPDYLFLVGSIFKKLSPPDAKVFESVIELNKELKELKLSGYHFLIKGSRGIKLEKTLEVIL